MQRQFLLAIALSFLVMSAAHILFVPWLGTVGMAIGMSAGYLVQTCGAIMRYRRISGVPVRELLVPGRADRERLRVLSSRLGARWKRGGRA